MLRKAASKVLRTLRLQRIARDADGNEVPAWALTQGALQETGWLRSYREGVAVDRQGRPLAWLSYASLGVIEPRLNKRLRVFEYGSGNGTLWWSRRVKSVTAVEHDGEWFKRVKTMVPANATVLHEKLDTDGRYAKAILGQPGTFDIVVVDGRDRVNCAKHAVRKLGTAGVIVWDNAERERYAEGQRDLEKQGFKKLELTSMVPVDTKSDTTTIFYRDRNCLGL